MWLALGGYWAIGFVASLTLAFPLGLGGIGVWIGLALGLPFVAKAANRKSTRLNSSHHCATRCPSSASKKKTHYIHHILDSTPLFNRQDHAQLQTIPHVT